MEEKKHIPKRSLGQNFLTAPDMVTKIVTTGRVTSADSVLEIGPGKGVLTRELLATGAAVIAVEKDNLLFAELQSTFAGELASKQLTLLHGDILELVDTIQYPEVYKLIANIPYNITGKILSTFLSAKNKPTIAVLMVQYEVAARIAAKSNKGSILGISVAVYGVPKLVKKVAAGAFFPKPNVDSAILCIDNISNQFFIEHNIPEQDFFSILKAGFAHKRKKLLRNILDVFPEIDWRKVFSELQLDENTRAEDISTDMWAKLTKLL
jgi:16S rRNA (adenine1518-N6/adenine1519-N6)-dimethyltransferase